MTLEGVCPGKISAAVLAGEWFFLRVGPGVPDEVGRFREDPITHFALMGECGRGVQLCQRWYGAHERGGEEGDDSGGGLVWAGEINSEGVERWWALFWNIARRSGGARVAWRFGRVKYMYNYPIHKRSL